MAKTMTKKKREAGAQAPSFERSLSRLEKIVELLDDGNLPLDESLALFKEGTKLAKACRAQLAEAEVQVKQALAQADAGGDEDDDELDEEEDEDEELPADDDGSSPDDEEDEDDEEM